MLTGYYKTERLQKRLVKCIKFFLKNKKTKGVSMVVKNIEIFQKIKRLVG